MMQWGLGALPRAQNRAWSVSGGGGGNEPKTTVRTRFRTFALLNLATSLINVKKLKILDSQMFLVKLISSDGMRYPLALLHAKIYLRHVASTTVIL